MSVDVKKALKMANRMTALADGMESAKADEHTLVLSGVLRDCAYKVRGAAEEEKQRLKIYGKWE